MFSEAKLQEKITEAEGQLRQYATGERIQQVAGRVTLRKVSGHLQWLGVDLSGGSGGESPWWGR